MLDLKTVHGLFNFSALLLLTWQGLSGWQIRRNRCRHTSDYTSIKQHRRLGPFSAVIGISGYLFGLMLSLYNHGEISLFRQHFLVGTALCIGISSLYLCSRQIKGEAPVWRTIHLLIGIMILCLYPLQVHLGLRILL